MKHKLLSFLLCLAMALSLLPTAALADGETVTYPAEVQNEKELRYALYSAPANGTQVTIKLTSDITLEMLYAAENFGTEKLDDNAAGDTFNRYKLGVHPTAEDPDHWNPLVINQKEEERVAYGAYYHMSATDERIARLVVKEGQNIKLDLNGHTIQKNARATHGDWSNTCTDIIGNYGRLTITDTSTGEKGTIKGIGYISCAGAVLHNYTGATLTVGAVNVDGNAAGMAAGTGQYVIANDGGTISIDGTNVYDTATSASLLVNTAGTMTVRNNAVLNHPNTKTINAKGGNVTIENATISSDMYAIFATKDSSVTINRGVTINGTGTVKKDENTATVKNNTGAGLPVPVGYEWVEENGTQTLKMNAAVVGGVNYPTLAEAFKALNGTNHTLTLIDGSAWDDAKPVYWAAGTQSGYVAKLTDALTAAYKANAGDITIVCRPGADVGEMTHGHVADTLTIYGNDAYISGGECDLEVDQYKYNRTTGKEDKTNGKYLEKDITITAYELDNLGVWGTRNTSHTVTINLNDCDGKAIEGKDNPQRVYINGTSGVNDITLINCDFLTKATAVYSNADGEIVIDSCSFTGGQAPVNFNHGGDGVQTVTVKNSKFENCGDAGDWKQFAAPIRFVNSGSGTMSANVDACTITGTVGSNGDILIGDGRDGKESKDVSLTVKNTAANVQAQKPGYYGADGAVSDTSLVRKTSVANSATPVTITLDSDSEAFDLAQVGDRGYSNLTEAITAAQSGGKTVTLLTADDALLQTILDGQYGSIDGLTIELSTGSYGQLVLGRATKYAGSNTEYYVGGFDESSDKYKKFDSAEDLRAYKNSGGWTPNCYYVRNMKDVTLKAAAGADVEIAGMTATAGHIYGTSGAPVTDYVLDTKTESTVGSYYLAQNWSNITFDGLTFTAKVDIASSLEKTAIDGVSFENCNFNINNVASGNQALRYYNELDNEKVSGLTVDNCTFTNCFQGVYTQKIKNITVTNSTFDTTAHNAIAIQSGDKAANHGDVVITNNTFTDIGDRIIRFNNVAKGTNITITGNTATNSGDDTGEVIKATSIAEGVTTTIYSNNWGPGTTVGNDEFQDTAAPSPGGSSSYTITTKDTDNGSISVSPSRASSGRTVTITVDPDEGYVLDELTVTDSKGEKVELTKVSDTKYTFTMPRSQVTIEATFVEDPDYVEPDPSTSVADIFDDIQPGAWYEDAVQFAYDEGIMTGTSKTTFEPNTTTTRGMIVSILHRLEGNPVVTEEAFSDVSADDWYGKAVAWASSEGIVGGYGDGTFQPNKAITREEMASILYRYAQYKDQDVSARADLTKYTDADQVGAWAEDVMQWANAEGLINGMTEDTLVPQGNATRAQVAAMFQRYLNK